MMDFSDLQKLQKDWKKIEGKMKTKKSNTQRHPRPTRNVRLTPADNPTIEAGMKILEQRGLIRPTVSDVFRAALSEFVKNGGVK